ncbi:hypothetical protein [Parasphingorhabdus sp.]|uniref:hypothetical protein n=1 Tax=Parasphingorhabdus sp. TaxID=2709688 RepID=UPI003D2DD419
MQILESSIFGLRSARLAFESANSNISVTLFPMVHIGQPVFFEQVYADAFGHDVVLVEGVRSPISRYITRSYRWAASGKLGLSVQPAYPKTAAMIKKTRLADVSGDQFLTEWKKIPVWQRGLLYLLSPLIGIHHHLFYDRESLANNMAMEDFPSSEDSISYNPDFAALNNCIFGVRDEILTAKLREEIEQAGLQSTRIAIVFGAAHMRAVISQLSQIGLSCQSSDWMTVFPLED